MFLVLQDARSVLYDLVLSREGADEVWDPRDSIMHSKSRWRNMKCRVSCGSTDMLYTPLFSLRLGWEMDPFKRSLIVGQWGRVCFLSAHFFFPHAQFWFSILSSRKYCCNCCRDAARALLSSHFLCPKLEKLALLGVYPCWFSYF